MHIIEGYLSASWAIFWCVVALPLFILELRSPTPITQAKPELKLLLALAGAFTFVLSTSKMLEGKSVCHSFVICMYFMCRFLYQDESIVN
ncbi:hypothetical protein A6770_11385 [Nostoc minutum NIES-26]|uniref:Uncharacterized protein n=1 Tax=Nostoc minutum NIES-26 TaxID=1844469 RepID=A0A367RUY4_9NOSO|nr:hypothetical protein A6770_11385 [Nostoc minutum NIES-26]